MDIPSLLNMEPKHPFKCLQGRFTNNACIMWGPHRGIEALDKYGNLNGDTTIIIDCTGRPPFYCDYSITLVDSVMNAKKNRATMIANIGTFRRYLEAGNSIVFCCSKGQNRSGFAALFTYMHAMRKPFVTTRGTVYPQSVELPAWHFLHLLAQEEEAVTGSISTRWNRAGRRSAPQPTPQQLPSLYEEEEGRYQLPPDVDEEGLRYARFDTEGRLHCSNGPALEYHDQTKIWYQHGVRKAIYCVIE